MTTPPTIRTERRPAAHVGASTQSLADLLRRIAGTEHDVLLPEKSIAHVHRVAQELPSELGRWSYLESRLLDAQSVDLVCIVDRSSARTLLDVVDNPSAPAMFSRPVWSAALQLLRAWVERTERWADAVDHFWLEFDTGSGDTPDPGVFACFGEHRPRNYAVAAERSVMHAVARAFFGVRADLLLPAFDHFLDTLGADAYVPYLGAMLQRPTSTLRICVTKLSHATIISTLARGAGPHARGAAEMLRELLPQVASVREPGVTQEATMLHVDIGSDGIEGRIGIEYGFERAPQLRGTLPNAQFLQWLVAHGWCTTAARDGLVRWPGLGLATGPGDARPHRTARLVNHTKLVLNGAEPLVAKAYLALTHWPVPLTTLQHAFPE
jgi:hypothetical protein